MAARRLDFLPYHFLLTSVGEAGVLRYQARRPCTCEGVHMLQGRGSKC